MSIRLNQPQNDDDKQEFIIMFVEKLNKVNTERAPLKSVIIAQAILESGWGNSSLSSTYNNYFGIKGAYHGNTIQVPTFEYDNGMKETINDNFKVYPSITACIEDYIELMQYPRYKNVRESKNYNEAAYALINGGYATDPSYAEKLINLIESYRLNQYDY